MVNWNELLNEVKAAGSTYDIIRRKYLSQLFKITNRNVVVYYSGWLQKGGTTGTDVNDGDKNGMMAVFNKLNRKKGLDLFLHTPGGDTAATESIVDYLRSMFGTDIRVIVPQLAMSAGTMIACASKEILMGKHSSLGPIDPQYGNVPAHGVVEEFQRAAREIREDQSKIAVWQPIIAKYNPTLIGECEKSIEWANEMVQEWLKSGMFKGDKESDKKIKKILQELGDHSLNKSHARHLSVKKCKDMGLKIVDLENDQKLQDAVLSVHHACIQTLDATPAVKIIENHNGVAFIQTIKEVLLKA